MTLTKWLRILLTSLFLLNFKPVLAQAPFPSLPDIEFASSLGEDLFVQSGSTGMVLVVVRDNQVFFRGYGETAPNSQKPPTEGSVLRLCSLTKIFTADVLTKLVIDRTVRLGDPLQHFAPRRAVVPKLGQPITLADLATHTSGLPRELGNPPRGTPHFTFPDYGARWRWLPNQHLHSTPGTTAVYSNVAFDLLSDALQSAAHRPYAALLAERTLNPLHMRNTTFFPSSAQCSDLLIGASEEGPCTSTEETAGSSGLYSTASDMEIWLKYLLGTGGAALPLLPSKLIGQKGLDHAGEPTGVGLGWIHLLPISDLSHIIEKTGGGAGFSTYIAINHSRHTAIFLAATDGPVDTHLNLFNGANKLLLAVAGLPPLPPPSPKPATKRKHRPRHR